MRCAAVQKLLNRYHDARLDQAARGEVERHLANCPACREELTQLEGVAGLWARVKTPPVPEGFAELVMQQARKRRVPQPQRSWASWALLRWWWEQSFAVRAAAATVVVVGACVGVLLGVSTPSASGPMRPSYAVTENMALLSGAPHGSLEQNYLALAFPSEASKPSP